MADTNETILAVRGLKVNFSTPDGTVEAVKGIDLDVRTGETLAVVGESGSGKSQTMMGIMGLLAKNGTVTGSARYRGQELVGLSPKALNGVRGSKITMIFQEPMTSLDPLYTIGRQIAEPIVHHRGGTFKQARKRVLELLELVGIPEPGRRIDSYPHELSGGQRQRVMIAMALANEPDLLIADEPTTALDVTIQAQILDLLKSLQKRFGMAIVLITHDLGIVKHFAERVAVMRRGEVVEQGTTADIFERPQADYTKMLLAAEPSGRKAPPADGAPIILEGRDVCVDYAIGGGFSPAAMPSSARSTRSTCGFARARRSALSVNPAPASRRSGVPCCGFCRAAAITASARPTSPASTAARCARYGVRCNWCSRIPMARCLRAGPSVKSSRKACKCTSPRLAVPIATVVPSKR